MSTVSSSTTDSNTKYHRLSVEFVKIKNQLTTLKEAYINEQTKNQNQQKEINLRDQKLRKILNENEGLLFRNEQLIKRIEALQSSLDEINSTFLMAKNKKKHKEANLRLFGEPSRRQAFNLSDPLLVIEQELERKIAENGQLHLKIYDLEKQFEVSTNKLTQQINELEKNNKYLKELLQNNSSNSFVHSFSTNLPDLTITNYNLNQNKENDKTNLTKNLNELKTHDFNITKKESLQNPSTAFETTEKEKIYYLEKIKNLTASLRHVTGRAEYYQQECECLIKRSLNDIDENLILKKKLANIEEKCSQLMDSLETTQINYEFQMRGLYEHMAEQDKKIIKQSENFNNFCNKTTINKIDEKKESKNSIRQNLKKIVGK